MFNFDYDCYCNAEIDPGNYFYHNISNNCQCFTDHQFSNFESDKVFSIIHFNCRIVFADFTWRHFLLI